MTLTEIQERFPTEQDAIKYFEEIRWGGCPQCSYCGSKRLSERLKDNRFKCYQCAVTSSVTAGTYLHGTNVKLHTWLCAFALISNSEKEITASELRRQLGISYLAAWKIYCTIRDMMAPEYKEGSTINAIAEIISIVGLKKRLKRCQSTVERCIRVKSRKESILQMHRPKTSLKFSRMMAYIAKADNIFFMLNGIDTNLIVPFWDMIERQIRARYAIINLKFLRKYIIQAVFEIKPTSESNLFDILLNNSMKEIIRTEKVRDTGW